jgi:hypothetical protein
MAEVSGTKQRLAAGIQALEDKIDKNSHNSNKPANSSSVEVAVLGRQDTMPYS